jgi:hypothetical protein
MRSDTEHRNKITDLEYNSVALSLATGGGMLFDHGPMTEIVIYTPKIDMDSLLLEKKFLVYWIETRLLFELYNKIWDLQEEMNFSEQQSKFLEDEVEKAIIKKTKNSKKVAKMNKEPSVDDVLDDDSDPETPPNGD